MLGKRYLQLELSITLFLLLCAILFTGCTIFEPETATSEKLRISVELPNQSPLPIDTPVEIIFRADSPEGHHITHIELYAVDWPSRSTEPDPDKMRLFRSHRNPQNSTSLATSTSFMPPTPGDYVFWAMAYTKQGDSAKSVYQSFEVR